MILQRLKSPPDRTLGLWHLEPNHSLLTMERPWLDNQVNVSCIPSGHYKFKRDTHGRFQWFRLLDVTGRTNIELHEGSKPSHSEGCILMSNESLKSLLWFCGDTSIEYDLEIKDYE